MCLLNSLPANKEKKNKHTDDIKTMLEIHLWLIEKYIGEAKLGNVISKYMTT